MIDDALLDSLTERFYQQADADPLLGPVLSAALPPARRPEHFAIFRDFWSRILLGSDRYQGNAFTAHHGLPLKPEHFQRWLEIFDPIADELLPPDLASRAKGQAHHMSGCLQGQSHAHPAGKQSVSWPLGRISR